MVAFVSLVLLVGGAALMIDQPIAGDTVTDPRTGSMMLASGVLLLLGAAARWDRREHRAAAGGTWLLDPLIASTDEDVSVAEQPVAVASAGPSATSEAQPWPARPRVEPQGRPAMGQSGRRPPPRPSGSRTRARQPESAAQR